MDIRCLACDLAEAVQAFWEKARRFFHAVMLIDHRCPECMGSLVMVSEGKCRCVSCGNEFDPTTVFQRCSVCGGVPVLRVRRYECRDCGGGIESRFLFDGLVFDAEYFRAKMAESRRRRQEQRERVRQMLAGARSPDLAVEHAELAGVPGLREALDGLTADLADNLALECREQFDLSRHERHVRAHLRDYPVSLARIPPLTHDARRDLIWRFIAVISLAHAGLVDIWQDGEEIMVMKHEADGEGQDIPGESEDTDGVEGLVG